MGNSNLTSASIKNFTGLKSLEEVTTQLDLVFARLNDVLGLKSQTVSLLDSQAPVPSMRAGDFVLDYRDGRVIPGMSDGKNVQPFSLDVITGVVSAQQHGVQPAEIFDEDGNLIGQLHPNATTSDPGFMSAADKTRFASLQPAASVTIVDASAGTVGGNDNYARSDHAHQVAVGTPVAVGTANAAGISVNLARADHVHSHGNQAGGALHAAATTATAGFMSAGDKTEHDALTALTLSTGLQTTNVYLRFFRAGIEYKLGPAALWP